MWKRIKIYYWAIVGYLILNVLFYIVNKELNYSVIPEDIGGYLFWLSLGLYLGFELCMHECKRIWELTGQKKDNENNETQNSGTV
jgi:hypothetical protein